MTLTTYVKVRIIGGWFLNNYPNFYLIKLCVKEEKRAREEERTQIINTELQRVEERNCITMGRRKRSIG